jgi:hypothetical protein
MNNVRRITLNLPEELLKEALDYTGKNITETVVAGLEFLKRARAYKLGMKLKGRMHLNIDVEASRERGR